MKIVLNKCFGGFGVSERLQKILGAETPYFDIDRTNPVLVEEVEKANALNQPELASDQLARALWSWKSPTRLQITPLRSMTAWNIFSSS